MKIAEEIKWLVKYNRIKIVNESEIQSLLKEIRRLINEKEELKSKLDFLRDAGGTFKLKINTVVSEWNWDDIVIPQMQELDCNRIKILKQMPFGNSKGITQEQFYFFLLLSAKLS